MSQSQEPRQGRGGIVGSLVLATGLVLLGVVMAADIGGPPVLERLAFALGLAAAPLLEGVGIALTLVGGYMLWRVRHPD